MNIDDRLLRQAKKVAAERGITLTALVQEAIRAVLTAPARGKRFRLRVPVVKGRRGPAVDVADREALYDFMEDRR